MALDTSIAKLDQLTMSDPHSLFDSFSFRKAKKL